MFALPSRADSARCGPKPIVHTVEHMNRLVGSAPSGSSPEFGPRRRDGVRGGGDAIDAWQLWVNLQPPLDEGACLAGVELGREHVPRRRPQRGESDVALVIQPVGEYGAFVVAIEQVLEDPGLDLALDTAGEQLARPLSEVLHVIGQHETHLKNG